MNYFLHGNLGSAEDWGNEFDGVKVDLWEGPELNFWDWALDFCGDVRAAGNEENVLVGYSLGGRLALHALIAGGADLWSRAVIVAAHPGISDVDERAKRLAQDQVLAQGAREWPWEKFLQAWNTKPVLAGEHGSSRQVDLESRREAIAAGFENWSLGAQEDLREKLAGVNTPVTWVTGELDEKFSELGEEMAGEVMPEFCDHVVVPDCGHRVIFERPDVVAELV